MTDKQREYLAYINQYVEEWGYAPTYREIGEAMGVGLTTVRMHLFALKDGGYIRQTSGVARSIVVLKGG